METFARILRRTRSGRTATKAESRTCHLSTSSEPGNHLEGLQLVHRRQGRPEPCSGLLGDGPLGVKLEAVDAHPHLLRCRRAAWVARRLSCCRLRLLRLLPQRRRQRETVLPPCGSGPSLPGVACMAVSSCGWDLFNGKSSFLAPLLRDLASTKTYSICFPTRHPLHY